MQDLRAPCRPERQVGSSPAIQHVRELIAQVAPTESSVLITGETGTGKELIARTIHQDSPRAERRMVALNCGAVQPTLIESELFGHEAGSFTGAKRTHKGVFEQAQGGTLFLDEITEMPAELQVKLLRVLEERRITRVGGERSIEIDVRLLAASNCSPEEAVEEGRLREDLLYRINVFPIHAPPLRERGDDVVLLAEAFLEQLNRETGEEKSLHPDAIERLRTHDWPGNVRELRNMIERAYILAGDQVETGHIRLDGTPDGSAGSARIEVPVGSSIADAEKKLILATLEAYDGDKKQAAQVLGISLKTLYNRLNSYGMGRGRSGKNGSGGTPGT